ncbi:MAG: PAC2 family protein [Deltaproteobacteria bacterium]|nr:PAC2 family protein [Deltaproteobacteria bacterium]
MSAEGIEIEQMPDLQDPLFIAGFEGWGNALNISKGMIDYLIDKLNAKMFGKLDPDLFYRFDENRPVVDVEDGLLKKMTPPGGFFYSVRKPSAGRDLIIFKAVEPSLAWFRFVNGVLSLCHRAGVKTIVSLGSMYDNVLHSDIIISALASSEEILARLKERNVTTVTYKGPSAVHSAIQVAAQQRGFECVSLWCHCPYYLQGTTHFGLLSRLGAVLSSFGGFDLDTGELETVWSEVSAQIQGLIDKSPELQTMIDDLRKAKRKSSLDPAKKGDKVIHLEDFQKPK